MVERDELVARCESVMASHAITDYCPNGLQVEGRAQVQRVLAGVTACEALLDEAIRWDACAVLVHHGYFWRGEAEPLVGMKGRRVAKLIRANQNLIAYHLPLDVHPTLGNNAQLASRLGLQQTRALAAGGTEGLLWVGELDEAEPLDAFAARVAGVVARTPTVVGTPARGEVKRVALCSGGAQGFLSDAAALGADVYISGEISERTTHEARELGVGFLAAGHHATERLGVQALGAFLANECAIEYRFFDVENPA
ncbi:MAG: Nif3-like dinuclear metal center hexameric protein [Pseudomonadota bacterium]